MQGLLYFIFDVYDSDESGRMSYEEFKTMMLEGYGHRKRMSANVIATMKRVELQNVEEYVRLIVVVPLLSLSRSLVDVPPPKRLFAGWCCLFSHAVGPSLPHHLTNNNTIDDDDNDDECDTQVHGLDETTVRPVCAQAAVQLLAAVHAAG